MSNNSKYHAVKYNGYDSKKEAARARVLHMLEDAGVIEDLREQVPFVLIPPQYEDVERFGKNGKKLKTKRKLVERACRYVADFTYTRDGKYIVEDTKGVRTPDYKIKRKLMLYLKGIKINEV